MASLNGKVKTASPCSSVTTNARRSEGLAGVSRRRFATTTVRDGARPAPDLVDRTFTADRPNALWVAEITYVPTWVGFVYLAVVLDAFSRRIVRWSMATTLATKLVLDALDMALWQRRPKDVIHHSDQGSQYTSLAFGNRCTSYWPPRAAPVKDGCRSASPRGPRLSGRALTGVRTAASSGAFGRSRSCSGAGVRSRPVTDSRGQSAERRRL
jgi:Integrase core domain